MNDIIHADCLSILPDIPDASVDLILTDPPYSTTKLDLDKGFDIGRFLPEFRRVLKPYGQFMCFASFELACQIASSGWKFRFAYIWEKHHAAPQHWNAMMPARMCELIYCFVRPDMDKPTRLYFDRAALQTSGAAYRQHSGKKTEFNTTQGYEKGVLTVNDGHRDPVDILRYPSKTGFPTSERTSHPTQKPLGLAKLIVKGYCPPDGLVLDPFAGSGTTPVAAKLTGRRYIAVEIRSKYYAIASHRLGMPVNLEHTKELRPSGQTSLEGA